MAADVPLSIRIHQSRRFVNLEPDYIRKLTRWLAPVAKRIYSLELSEDSTPVVLNATLCCWLEHGVPGTVRELRLWAPSSDRHKLKYIQPRSRSDVPVPWRINLSATELDAFLEPITVLYLDGKFARWDSHAYRGLTHLLLSDSSIKEDQLIGILSNSPQLRSLTYTLLIKHKKLRKFPPPPVNLPNLETLVLRTLRNTDLWAILRLLAPGPKPLTLSLTIWMSHHSYDFAETPEAQAFFQRSNIQTCHLDADGWFRETWFPDILYKIPNLRRICLQIHSYLDPGSLIRSDEFRVCSQLNELIMIDCELDLDEFKELLVVHRIQILRLWNCPVFRHGNKLDMKVKELEEELSDFVTDAKCYWGTGNVSWDPCLGFVDVL